MHYINGDMVNNYSLPSLQLINRYKEQASHYSVQLEMMLP